MGDESVTITVTRSAGDDRAVLILIDTTFEPSGCDGGPGLRILVNDDEAFVGKAYDLGTHHEAHSKALTVPLDQIPYVEPERRYVVQSANGITFIVVDTTTRRNVGFDRKDVPLTFGAPGRAREWADRLNGEVTGG